MPKIKPARKSVTTDMTAMCDVAFLLLTFFILTTKFKPDEAVVVDTPSSVQEIKLPESNVMQITIAPDGKLFFGIDGQHHRRTLLEKISSIYQIGFTEEEYHQFELMPSFGVSIQNLKKYLNMSADQRKKFDKQQLVGVPYETPEENELNNWVLQARITNPKFAIAIKGDKDMSYKAVNRVIKILQDQNVNKVNLVTNLEAAPEAGTI